MANIETQYLRLLQHVFSDGTPKEDRTGVGTRSIFGTTLTHDMSLGFPLLTTKKVNFKAVLAELLWFISGSTNVQDLWKHGVHIWDDWADPETGSLGPVYGRQWRCWSRIRSVSQSDDGSEAQPMVRADHIDQLIDAETTLRNDPDSRRIIVSAWNPADLDLMALPPCHLLFQFYSEPTPTGRKLHLQVYQRSADLFIGVPFNIASYGLLLELMARTTDHLPGRLNMVFGDAHIYRNHADQVLQQLGRDPYPLPLLQILSHPDSIINYRYPDIGVYTYTSHPFIKAPVAV